jgi:hypothetical protein
MTEFLKKSRYLLTAALILIGFFTVVFLSRAAFAKQLSNWQVTPLPQRYTELYFTDYRKLPTSYTVTKPQKLAFTVHNLEHQVTSYDYKFVAKSEDNSKTKLLGQGTFTLAHGQSRVTNLVATIPPLSQRIKISINLSYESIALAKNSASLQTQSIDYLVNSPSNPVGTGVKHETK